ncbi:Wzz/FepE/Etk N-terminal domain-containing protein [uncultured Prochlorococcus sp.]|uniref:GumC family protein n=1 Tax=uncultured Prochlorococcus sp. TaxID=159733 RepID=UPI0025833425|nr:Wzz/FepE/Etk N-terminal domain-containing protein [uncultured Prochlorococcus sp.]
MPEKSNINRTQYQLDDDGIDIKIIFNFFLRNKIIIGSVSFLFFIVACFYSLTLKRVWEGQFQIVLNSENKSVLNFQNNLPIQNLLNQPSSDLNTQVGILKSQSVLMPLYKYVTSIENLDSSKEDLNFSSWKKNLTVQLEKKTSILNIAYRDTNKKLIIPALEKMANIYQDYSGEAEKRSEELTRQYLLGQIKTFKLKSSNSLKEAQEFAIEQDLIFNDGIISDSFKSSNPKSSNSSNTNLGSNIEIENIRAAAANRIRLIDLQIKKIKEIGDDIEKLQYIGSNIPSVVEQGLPQQLTDVEIELVRQRILYTENDSNVLRMIQERDLLVELLKKMSIGYLVAERLETEAKMQSAMRPKGVLLKYKELLRQAARDEATLVKLENDLRVVELQQAKVKDSWKLITNPRILQIPVAPNRKNIGFMGLLFGFFLGSTISLYKEKRSDKIYELDFLKKIISAPFIDEIIIQEDISKSQGIIFIKEFIKSQPGKKVFFLCLKYPEIDYLKTIKDHLNLDDSIKKDIELIHFPSKLNSCITSDTVLLFVSYRYSKYSDIKNLNEKLSGMNINLNGFTVLI